MEESCVVEDFGSDADEQPLQNERDLSGSNSELNNLAASDMNKSIKGSMSCFNLERVGRNSKISRESFQSNYFVIITETKLEIGNYKELISSF